jgi:MinD-like ATPase involved in chromosome partitioning or flagellar assembly
VTWARSEREAARVGVRLAEVARRYAGVEIAQLGSVPHDWEVSAAVRERRPLLAGRPNCAASAALRRGAWRLWQWLGPAEAAAPGGGGWLARAAAGM